TGINKLFGCFSIHDGTDSEHQIRKLLAIVQYFYKNIKRVLSSIRKLKDTYAGEIGSFNNLNSLMRVVVRKQRYKSALLDCSNNLILGEFLYHLMRKHLSWINLRAYIKSKILIGISKTNGLNHTPYSVEIVRQLTFFNIVT